MSDNIDLMKVQLDAALNSMNEIDIKVSGLTMAEIIFAVFGSLSVATIVYLLIHQNYTDSVLSEAQNTIASLSGQLSTQTIQL